MSWRKILIVFILLCAVTVSCSSTKYNDGCYCAEIQYPKTGTRSTYTLPIDIKDNKLVRINWSNGGWLDETHFTPPDISNGEEPVIEEKNNPSL